MIKIDEHVFQGMQGDISVSKADGKYLTEATNIRITPRTDNDGFTITNEKGEVQLQLSEDFTNEPFLGSAVLNNYYILFTLGGIYRINVSDPQIPVLKLFDNSDNNPLNFKIDKPIETLVVYEKSDVQKVYWVDGENQPRVINIAVNTPYTDSKIFDFVQELALNETITIEKVYDASGEFPSGTVQYAFSYYNKYGQESNIFYTTGLYYSSPSDRGGRPDEVCKCGFKITVNNVDTRFEYLRIHSIIRTSLQATPQVKIVFDIDIRNIDENNPVVTYTDFNTGGKDIDSTELLYIGGEEIIAGTIAQKDNTLFLGNIEAKNRNHLNWKNTYTTREISQGLREIDLDIQNNSFYPWSNSLNCENTSTFKIGDIYRLGLQFQEKNGKWSEPLYIKDYTLEDSQTINSVYSSLRPTIDGNSLKIPKLSYSLDTTTIENFSLNKYVKVRPVVVLPNYNDRKILLQGILCPTIFNYKDRVNGSPYGQSSWFTRPIYGGASQAPQSFDNEEILQFLHGNTVSNYEVQGAYYDNAYNVEGYPKGYVNIKELEELYSRHDGGNNDDVEVEAIDPSNKNDFVIDQQLLTLHSPDIEFDTAIQNMDSTTWKLKIIGVCPLWGHASAIKVQTSTPAASSKYRGFKDYSSTSIKTTVPNSTDSWITHGVYEDMVLKDNEGEENGNANFVVYTWHRSGSLNNDVIRAEGTRTAVLERKKLSNISVCKDNIWLKSLYSFGDIDIRIFHSNEVSLVKLNQNTTIGGVTTTRNITYFGNIDTLHVPTSNYYIKKTDGGLAITDELEKSEHDKVYKKIGYETKEPIRIKYKSSPHIVLTLNNNTILPKIGSLNAVSEEVKKYEPAYRRYAGVIKTFHLIAPGNEPYDNSAPYTGFNHLQYSTEKKRVPFATDPSNSSLAYEIEPKTVCYPGNMSCIAYEVNGTPISDGTDYNSVAFLKYFAIPYLCNLAPKDIRETSTIPANFSIDPADINREVLEKYTTINVWDCPRQKMLEYSVTTYNWPNDIVISLTREITVADGEVWYFDNTLTSIPEVTTGEGTPWQNSGYYIRRVNKDGTNIYWGWEMDSPMTNNITQDDISSGNSEAIQEINNNGGIGGPYSFLYTAELSRPFSDAEEEETFDENAFGGKSPEALRNNLWFPAGEPIDISEATRTENGENITYGTATIEFIWGDTWYQRYDCLKTYPFTQEDENSVVDIVSFLCETRVNTDGRYDKNRGQQDNLSMSPINFNLMNPVYDQKDNYFNYRILDIEDSDNTMPNTITWSKTKLMGADIDLWTNITMANNLDLDGDKGELTAIRTLNSYIYAFQKRGIARILYNERVQIPTTDIPIEISNSYKVDGKVYISDTIGCQQKSSICSTPNGIYFVDMNNKDINLLSQDGIKSISRRLGFSTWMEKFTGSQFLDNWYIGVDGFKTFYDSKNKDVYFSTNDYCLGYSELLDQFVSFYPCYSNTVDIFNIGYDTYRTAATGTRVTETNYTYSTSLSKMFYGNYLQDFSIEFVSNQEFTTDKIFENLEVRADAEDNQSYDWSVFPFTHIKVYNEYQDTSDISLTYSSSIRHTNTNLRRKFRIWRIQIPRDYTNKRDRIRNTWCRIKLKRDTTNITDIINYKFRIHDVGVKYFQN